MSKKRSWRNKEDRVFMSELLRDKSSDIVSVYVDENCRKTFQSVDSYLTQAESGKFYVRGAPQTFTFFMHHLAGVGTRNKAAWPGMNGVHAQDVGALAPYNISPSRVVTLYEASLKTRMGLRFRTLLLAENLELSSENSQASTGAREIESIMRAGILVTPSPITDNSSHRKYWVNYNSKDYGQSGQKDWFNVVVRVTIKEGLLNRRTELWTL